MASSQEDYDSWERFTLICKPEQSGKTFIMIKMINEDLSDTTDSKNVVNFIFCDNNLLLTKQTSERVNSDVLPYTDQTYVEFSSRNDGQAQRNSSDVIHKIICRDIRNIICCTNGTRVSDISTIIEDLNAGPYTKDKFIIKIWLDEADKFTKFIGNTFRKIVNNHNNVYVFCLTATPKVLFDKYSYINVLPLESTTREDYHGWGDNKLVILDKCVESTEVFIHDVLSNIEKPKRGTKWYIPADKKKRSHQMVRDILIAKTFAVFIVNGDGITLSLPNIGRSNYTEEKNDQLNKQILKMYRKYELHNYAVAITGNICVGRGISIMSPEFTFDFAILSNCTKKAEASQNAGRLKGNIKKWPNYKPPVVYTTKKFDKVAREWEEKSRKLAVKAFEKLENGENTIITKTGFKTLSNAYEYIKHPNLFADMNEVRTFLAQEHIYRDCMGLEKAPRPKGVMNKIREQCDGYALTTKLLKKGEKASDLTKENRLTKEMADAIGEGSCISTKKGSRYLILPVYESLDSLPNQELYQVRYLKFKN